MRGKCLMIQGTGSSVGKSLLCAALLRILRQDGYRCAPFKAQNMALNSFATREGLEMGRAQVTQAQAAGIRPSALMNPVLLKPTSDKRSQVIVNGRPVGNMSAMEYHLYKPRLRPLVKAAYDQLEQSVDYVVLEGAGSPAEINLREGDIVNMSMAAQADAPVLLVGDIDLGGVFAWLYGTCMLLDEAERARVKGVVINKFRGDLEILRPGLTMLEEKLGVPVVGVVPWMELDLEDEDSCTHRFQEARGQGDVEVAVVKLPHISNFTDFQALTLSGGCRVRYAASAAQLEGADILILPGTKNTIEDLIYLKNRGMDAAILRHARSGKLVVGICGGYQMLGQALYDPLGVESQAPQAAGLGLLDMTVTFLPDKVTCQAAARVDCPLPQWRPCQGLRVEGYEIHAGENALGEGAYPWLKREGDGAPLGVCNKGGNVLGAYLHGLFDSGHLWRALLRQAGGGGENPALTLDQYRERELDRLAQVVRHSLDMDLVYRIFRGEE